MSVIIIKRKNASKTKIYYSFGWGRNEGQRIRSGIFTYTRPLNNIQRNHNKEALTMLETKRSQMILDFQAINSGYIPKYKLEANFFDYYAEFVKSKARTGNRHLKNSLCAFEKFVAKKFISAIDINEDLCINFRDYLLSKYNGETPSGYFMRFKRVLKYATKQGYFRVSPAQDVPAKKGKNERIKDILTIDWMSRRR